MCIRDRSYRDKAKAVVCLFQKTMQLYCKILPILYQGLRICHWTCPWYLIAWHQAIKPHSSSKRMCSQMLSLWTMRRKRWRRKVWSSSALQILQLRICKLDTNMMNLRHPYGSRTFLKLTSVVATLNFLTLKQPSKALLSSTWEGSALAPSHTLCSSASMAQRWTALVTQSTFKRKTSIFALLTISRYKFSLILRILQRSSV